MERARGDRARDVRASRSRAPLTGSISRTGVETVEIRVPDRPHQASVPRALVVTTMMIGTVSTILAATIVNVAFPALIAEFHVGHDTVQWVAAGFLAATTATMLTTAWLVETLGERRTFVITIALFLAASIMAAISWNPGSLIAARIVQGACAGILQPLAMIVLFRVFPVNERGRAMALYGFGIVLAPAIGPA